jgi:patatin-related protein
MAYQREVRLGLVLYGGVSLAVYENGMAQEFYHAVRGDGLYGLLALLIDSDIVVDIISGTSAGGVNGVMLAYALANRKLFTPSAELWRNDGDIQALMRLPDDPNDPNVSSLLNSDYYQARLENCFAAGLTDDASAPSIGELDLFVTATDANGAISTSYDDLGHAVDIKNHRALFKLAYRGERKNDFVMMPNEDPAGMPPLLAKLSRMTSCFPVAFEPVRVTQTDAMDEKFVRWGKLHNSAVYLDGGILDNKPFTSTIDAIAGRTATREVERFLIYVEPKPEQFAQPPVVPSAPTIVQAAIASLVTIPGYQSIAGDLVAIEAHNERAARLAGILEALPAAKPSKPECLDEAGIVFTETVACDPSVYYAARLIQLRDTAVEAILDDENKGREYFPEPTRVEGVQRKPSRGEAAEANDDDARRSGRILVQSFTAWPSNGIATLEQYDIFYRMRRTKHLMNTMMRAEKKGQRVPAQLWEGINHCFKLYEIAQAMMIGWLTKFDFGWKALSSHHPDMDSQTVEMQQRVLGKISVTMWGNVQNRLDEFLQTGVTAPTEISADKREDFHKQLEASLRNMPAERGSATNLLDSIDGVLKQVISGFTKSDDAVIQRLGSVLRDEFCRFLEVDQQLFLMQVGSGFESSDMVRVVRFSPVDAQRCLSQGTAANKVRGSSLASFGGFFKKSWRANDIMMGRLDAACLLTECLLTKERLTALAPRRMLTPVKVTPAQLQVFFGHLEASAAVKLAKTINTYLAHPTAMDDAQWNSMIDGIVCAAHHEIQLEEWPQVISCAIDQEYTWSQYRQNTKGPETPYDARNLFWNRAKAKPDEVLVKVAAHCLADKNIPPFAPGMASSGSFAEQIPDSVLEELGSQATIRLGKGLLASISNEERRGRWAGKLLFTIPFNWLAPGLYRWARMRRTQPATVIVLNTILPVFCLTLIGLALVLPSAGVAIDTWHRLGMVGVGCALLILWGRGLMATLMCVAGLVLAVVMLWTGKQAHPWRWWTLVVFCVAGLNWLLVQRLRKKW